MKKTVIKTNQNAYFLRYSINAHCEAEELLGFPITQLDENTAGISVFRTLMFVGLKHGGQQITLEQAGDIMEEVINDRGMEYLSEQISKAINAGLSQQNKDNFKRDHNKKQN